MIRSAAAALIITMVMSVPAKAADEARANAPAAATTAAETTVAPVPAHYRTLTGQEWLTSRRRPAALPGLYASFAALQVFDVYTTQRAISAGAREANPVMKGVIGNRAAFWTIKGAATVGPMLLAERMWKRNKLAAIAMMAASNGVMAAVAAHNAGVMKTLR